jgi:superfamily II DNA or RNA helicase
MNTLRPYQLAAIAAVRDSLSDRPILCLPTGSGKTYTAANLVADLALPTLWVAHRKELIEQAARDLSHRGLTTGIIMAGYSPTDAPVQVGSVQTLARRTPPAADLVVIDECHHVCSDSYSSLLSGYHHAHIVGLTATPFRLDGRGLGSVFGRIIAPTSTRELCDLGILHAPRVWCGKAPDLRGVAITGGDYNAKQVAERANTQELTGDIVAEWEKHAGGARTVCFATDVEHSKAIVDAFRSRGIAAEHLDGSMSRDDREGVLARLSSGQTRIVSNCMVLTEGWDLPALEVAIVARPTASLNLHLQMIGRIMRACVGKSGAIVLDHAGNHHVHGLVTRELEYSLDSVRKTGESEPLGLRRCRKCGLYFEPAVFSCPDCGWHPVAAEVAARVVTGKGVLEAFADQFDYFSQVWIALESERMAAGYKPGWSAVKFHERFGTWPIVADGDLVNPAHATKEQKRLVYQQLAATAAAKGFKAGWASHRFKSIFGVWPTGFVGDVKREAIRRKFAEAMR